MTGDDKAAAEKRPSLIGDLLKSDATEIVSCLDNLDECEKLRVLLEKIKEQLPGRIETLALRASVNDDSEERRIVEHTRLVTHKTNKDEWEGEKTGSFATWINWSLVEIVMEHMAEPLQLAFKHSIYSRNYYIEEDEVFGITWSYGKEEGKLWNPSIAYSPRTFNESQVSRVSEILKTSLSGHQLISLVTKACVMPFYNSSTPRLDLPAEKNLFGYQSFVDHIDDLKAVKDTEVSASALASPKRRRENTKEEQITAAISSPTKRRNIKM